MTTTTILRIFSLSGNRRLPSRSPTHPRLCRRPNSRTSPSLPLKQETGTSMDLPGATVAVFLKRVMVISPLKGGVEDMGRNGSIFVVVDLVDMAIVMEKAGLTPNDPHVEGGGSGRGYEMKREGTRRANWGTKDDDLIAQGTEEEADMDGKLANSKEE
ncbi:unnamed protein product [Musa acuminata subsp. malaccensis]|uniref:(wild Malaysian banana) hypothetical protein n=1 Tax=Musa acuminata subsp. malaccensis TaxID=214687 RepID=A0A804JBX4_MUSAM|nr:PREDICTED: uncharacterized protein LOC103986623 [Musa acuminata subsp. malaccensis]CAG1845100.1 unnamed protein product [Musa acuminata subsp. malaccensis]